MVKKLGKRSYKSKHYMGLITALDEILRNARYYINKPVYLLLNCRYTDIRPIDASSRHAVEKILMFVIMQILSFVQEDTSVVVNVRYESQFINIRIRNCMLQHNMLRGNHLLKLITIMQHWIRAQNAYSDYIIEQNRICNFNIYLLRST